MNVILDPDSCSLILDMLARRDLWFLALAFYVQAAVRTSAKNLPLQKVAHLAAQVHRVAPDAPTRNYSL